MTVTAPAGGPGRAAEAPPPPVAPVVPPGSPRLPPVAARRRPALLAAGIALTALGALTASYLVQTLSGSHPVVAVVRPVPAGAVVHRADLAVANISADPVLTPVPAAALDGLVGKRAARALGAGSLLTADAVTDVVTPVAGQSLVGVALTPAQLPAVALFAGDQVRIVATPGAQGGPVADPGRAVAAVVVGVAAAREDGTVVVDVTVPQAAAADLAAAVSTGRVALVLDSRER